MGSDPGDGTPDEILQLVGTVTVSKEAPVTLSDGKIHTSTEITALRLLGQSTVFGGDVTLSANAGQQSVGTVLALCDEEPEEFPAVAFFDLFLDLQTPSTVLQNRSHEAEIFTLVEKSSLFKAPFHLVFSPVPLRDASGVPIAWLADLTIDPLSTKKVPALPAWGLVFSGLLMLLGGAVVFGRRRRTRVVFGE